MFCTERFATQTAATTLRKLLADHFYELDRAAKEGHPKVAWRTSVGPDGLSPLTADIRQ